MKGIKKSLVTALSAVAICCFALVGVNAAQAFAADGANENEYFVQGGRQRHFKFGSNYGYFAFTLLSDRR